MLELLILQPTAFCNIDCDYCYLPNRKDTFRMGLDTVRRAAEFVRGMTSTGGGIHVLWHVGEPMMLEPSWYEAAHEILSQELGSERLNFCFQSNGTLINREWVGFLKESSKVQIGISVDGPAFLHDAHRRTRSGRGTHAKVIAGLETLRGADIPFTCIAVVTRQALDFPDEFFDFFVDVGPTTLALSPEELEGANSTSSLLGRHSEQRYRRFLRRIVDLWLRDRPFEMREFSHLARTPVEMPRLPPSPNARNQESEPWRVVSIGSRGEVHTFSSELLGMDLPGIGRALGNVHTDTWDSIAASEAFKQLAAAIEVGNQNCLLSCPHFKACGGGAPSNKWFEHRSFAVAETMFCRLSIKAPREVYAAATNVLQVNRETLRELS